MKTFFALSAALTLFTFHAVQAEQFAGVELGVGTGSDSMESGPAASVYGDFGLGQGFFLRTALTYHRGDSKFDLLSSYVNLYGAEGGLVYRYKTERLSPFIGVGLGWYVPDYSPKGFDTELEALNVGTGEKIISGINDDLGYFATIGCHLQVTDEVGLGLSVKHVAFETTGNIRIQGVEETEDRATPTRDLDFENLYLTLSLHAEFW